MKAIQFNQTGGTEVLNYVDVASPLPDESQVLIRVESVSVNFADVMMRRGTYPMMPEFPVTPGLEVTGYVEKVGQKVRSLKPGQPVFAMVRGGYAEFVVAEEAAVFGLPKTVDLDQATALGVNYLTAYHILHTMGQVHAGSVVVVYSAAGGVGTAAAQLGKLAKLTTIGLTSLEKKMEFARSQGFSHIINYKTEQVSRRVLEITNGRGADLILNPVAGGTFHEDFQMLAPLGQIIWFGRAGGPPQADLVRELGENFGRGVGIRVFHLLFSVAEPYPELFRKSMDQMIKYLSQGKINPVISEKIPLAQAARAHELLETGEGMGKIVLKP